VVYDNQTRSELQTDQQFPSIGSQKKGIVVNPNNPSKHHAIPRRRILDRGAGFGTRSLIGKRSGSRYEAGKRTGAWVNKIRIDNLRKQLNRRCGNCQGEKDQEVAM
jgi:hypothetical protein